MLVLRQKTDCLVEYLFWRACLIDPRCYVTRGLSSYLADNPFLFEMSGQEQTRKEELYRTIRVFDKIQMF